MRECCKDVIKRYSIAVSSIIAATWVRTLLLPHVGDRVPFATYMLAVILTAWLAGTGPAILSLVLGVISAAHFFIPPSNSMLVTNPADLLALLTYATVCVVAISLFYDTSRQHAVTRGQLQQIEQLSAELRTADHRKDEFLALLAHELRNPLAAISTATAVLDRAGRSQTADRSHAIRIMRRQLDFLVTIVNDLLDVSRFVHRRIVLHCQPVDFREMVETAIEQVQPEIKRRRHDLQVTIPDVPVVISGDRIRVVQIITNLLSNAAKYTPREGRIQVLVDANDQSVVLQIVDNGIGISDETRATIFELFSRGKSATLRDQSGLGLGLPIARQFAAMHQGTLDVHTEGVGRGSRFVLTLPILPDGVPVADHAEDTLTDLPLTTVDGHSLPSDVKRVLVIDDNRDAAESLGALLTFEGYETQVAFDGPQGLRRFRDFHPDCVLLDIGLPGMDGFEVARRLRALPVSDPLQIIAVTGWDGPEFVERTRSAGFDQHLVKPVNPDRLVEILRGSAVPVEPETLHRAV